MKQPAIMFYIGDAMKDPGLRSLTYAARGLWFDMLCLMHECVPRGYLQLNGSAVTVEQLARMSGGAVDEVRALLLELRDAGVYSCDERGVIFSRRMVIDAIKAAHKSAGCSEGGKKGGGNPNFKRKAVDKGAAKGGSKGASKGPLENEIAIANAVAVEPRREREPSDENSAVALAPAAADSGVETGTAADATHSSAAGLAFDFHSSADASPTAECGDEACACAGESPPRDRDGWIGRIAEAHPRHEKPLETQRAIAEQLERLMLAPPGGADAVSHGWHDHDLSQIEGAVPAEFAAAASYLLARTELYRSMTDLWTDEERRFLLGSPRWFASRCYAEDERQWRSKAVLRKSPASVGMQVGPVEDAAECDKCGTRYSYQKRLAEVRASGKGGGYYGLFCSDRCHDSANLVRTGGRVGEERRAS